MSAEAALTKDAERTLGKVEAGIEDLSSLLKGFMTGQSLESYARRLDAVERAKLYSVLSYSLQVLFDTQCRLEDKSTAKNAAEIERVKAYISKIKGALSGTVTEAPVRRKTVEVDTTVAKRVIKHSIASRKK